MFDLAGIETLLPVAAVEDWLPFMIPMLVFMIPIIAILTSHQRKMAELIHGQKQALPSPEIDALRREVMELRQIVHQQTIAIDGLKQLPAPSVAERFEVN